RRTEQALAGKTWSVETLREALPILGSEFMPISDVRGAADYRRGLITSLFEKFYFDSIKLLSGRQKEPASLVTSVATPPRNRPAPHESAHKHVTGEAVYTDDYTTHRPVLEGWPVCSPHPRARIVK